MLLKVGDTVGGEHCDRGTIIFIGKEYMIYTDGADEFIHHKSETGSIWVPIHDIEIDWAK